MNCWMHELFCDFEWLNCLAILQVFFFFRFVIVHCGVSQGWNVQQCERVVQDKVH